MGSNPLTHGESVVFEANVQLDEEQEEEEEEEEKFGPVCELCGIPCCNIAVSFALSHLN